MARIIFLPQIKGFPLIRKSAESAKSAGKITLADLLRQFAIARVADYGDKNLFNLVNLWQNKLEKLK